MRKITAIILLLVSVSAIAEETTRINFHSDKDTAVYLMNSLLVDTRSNALVKKFDIYIKELTILGVSPFYIDVENGVYNLAVIDNDSNMTFPVRAEGQELDIYIKTAPSYHKALLYTFIASAVVTAISFEGSFTAENVEFGDNPLSYIGFSTAAVSIGTLIWWIATMPSVKIK